MQTVAKLAITLGVLGTMVAATTAPTLARTSHRSAQVHHYSQPDQPRGPYAQQPFGYRNRIGGDGPRNGPPAAVRPFVTWDPYGQRWDSAD